jgi:hypothetical protein
MAPRRRTSITYRHMHVQACDKQTRACTHNGTYTNAHPPSLPSGSLQNCEPHTTLLRSVLFCSTILKLNESKPARPPEGRGRKESPPFRAVGSAGLHEVRCQTDKGSKPQHTQQQNQPIVERTVRSDRVSKCGFVVVGRLACLVPMDSVGNGCARQSRCDNRGKRRMSTDIHPHRLLLESSMTLNDSRRSGRPDPADALLPEATASWEGRHD